MSGTFVICLVIALAAVAFWRQTLVLLIAVVLALLASGVGSMAQAITGEHAPPSVVAPVEPGQPPATGAGREAGPAR
jgi:drug/metabolite transporter (DMT)-like permease